MRPIPLPRAPGTRARQAPPVRACEPAGSDAEALVAIHLALAAILAWLSVALALMPHTFATSGTFAVMARLGHEDQWSAAFCAAAAAGVAGLATSSAILRLATVLAIATMHGVVALCFALAAPISTGSGTYAVVALLGYALAWRRTREVA